MAGLFLVLWGKEDGTFSKAESLNGTDGQPLLIPGSREENLTDRICTRPTAADINGDGHLDIISGNFAGTFFLFVGEGDGKFAPTCEKLMAGDAALQVTAHSDPFLVDWDSDGDLDIVSGSSAGGVFLSINAGTAEEPSFSEMSTLIEKVDRYEESRLGDAHISGPQTATRVWVDDVDQDGKLDVTVGDSVHVMFAADGVEEEIVLGKLEAWKTEQQKLREWWQEASQDFDVDAILGAQEGDEGVSAETKAAFEKVMEEYRERSREVSEMRRDIVRQESTGYVWVYYQK